MNALNFIDPSPVQKMREQEEVEAQKLRLQIAQLQEHLAVREARIAVLDEVLSQCKVDLSLPVEAAEPEAVGSPARPAEEPRNLRATASSMEERRDAVTRVFQRHGDMTPKELLVLVNQELGEELMYHQLRAVLRKYTDLFESRPDRHGIWGVVRGSARGSARG